MSDKKGGSEAYTTFTESQISALSNAPAGARYPVSSIQERGIKRTELVMPAQMNGEHLSWFERQETKSPGMVPTVFYSPAINPLPVHFPSRQHFNLLLKVTHPHCIGSYSDFKCRSYSLSFLYGSLSGPWKLFYQILSQTSWYLPLANQTPSLRTLKIFRGDGCVLFYSKSTLMLENSSSDSKSGCPASPLNLWLNVIGANTQKKRMLT